MSNIIIHKAGLLTTIQDGGRIGFQQYGIPVTGAMDQYAMQLANLLVGNDRYEATLEFTIFGPQVEFQDDRAFAITGGDFQPTLNGKKIKMYETIYANKGDELKLGSVTMGCRGYLAIAGGLDVDVVMGSRSTYLRGGFGGLHGRKIKDGDSIALYSSVEKNFVGGKIPGEMIHQYEKYRILRVIMGPEMDRFHDNGIKTFLNETYQLSNQCDRMGYRLEGPEIQHLNGGDMISGGINLGAIQVPGDGKPIIMMADHQTTGGYTKIANVISVDIPYLAQMKPGDRVNFKAITVEEAHELIHGQEKQITELMNRTSSSKKFEVKVNGKTYKVLVAERSP